MSAPDQQSETPNGSTGTPGVIDTIGNGFALLNRRPYLVWLPVVLDLLLWSGFRVSVSAPLSWLETAPGTGTSGVAEAASQVRDVFSSTELVHLVGALTPMLISELGLSNVPGLDALSGSVVTGDAGLALLALASLLTIFVGMSYLTMIGRLVIDRPAWGVKFWRDCLHNSIQLMGVVLTVVAVVVLLFAPFAALGLGLYLIGVDITAVLVGLGLIMLVWAFIHFFFSVHAITVNRASAFDAMQASYSLVHRHLLSVLGLLLIVLVIRLGMPIALQVFTESRWAVPFAVVVNAYVATGLIAATMLYFKSRTRTLCATPSGPDPAGTGR